MIFKIITKRRSTSEFERASVQPEPVRTPTSPADDNVPMENGSIDLPRPIPVIVVHPPPQDHLFANNVCHPAEAQPGPRTTSTPTAAKLVGGKTNSCQKRLGSRRQFQVLADPREDEHADNRPTGHPSSQRATGFGRDPLKSKIVGHCKQRAVNGLAPPESHSIRPGNALPRASLSKSEPDAEMGNFLAIPKSPDMPATESVPSPSPIKPVSQACRGVSNFRGGVARMSINLPKISKYVLADVEVPLHYDTLQRWCRFTFGAGVTPPMDTPTVGLATNLHWQGNILSSTEGTGRNAFVADGYRQAYLWGYRGLSTPEVETNLVLVEWAIAIPPQPTPYPSRSSTEGAVLAIVANTLAAMCTAGALELGPLDLNQVASNLGVQMRQAIITHVLQYEAQPQNCNP